MSKFEPTIFFHSPLKRARETAEIALKEYVGSSGLSTGCRSMGTLREVDFGGYAEGQPVQLVKARMMATYSAWALGELETRMVSDGESGREVLERAESSLSELVTEASKTKSRCVAAFSHSTFLRVILSTVLGISLLQASRLEQANACINVMDLDILSTAASHELRMHCGRVVRINEISLL
jgi:broad specificity phosphatase PhoE